MTIKDMRHQISQTILEEDNRSKLSPFLSFNWQFSFSPEDWRNMMTSDDEHCLPCDLPFVQLTSNLIHRDIILIPILQSDVEDATLDQHNQDNEEEGKNEDEKKDESEKQLLIINANDSNAAHPPLIMLYFPEGQFGSQSFFQSIDKNFVSTEILKKKINCRQALDLLEEDATMDNYEDDDDFDDDFNRSHTKSKGKFNQKTVLTPQDPASTIIINETEKTLFKKLKRGKDAPVYEIAPGEGKRPEEWLRKPNFDIDAFPHLHPDGKYGLYYERPKKLTPAKYLPQRILHKSTVFAKDHDYLFMAQQYLERYALERQIDMSLLSGSLVNDDDKIKMVPTDDKFSIFQSIPGTPAYWKKFRNEVYAR